MGWYDRGYNNFAPYVPVATRRANALRQIKKLLPKGTVASPVTVDGRKITTTFWGNAWCDNLTSYGHFSNRLPRGRTYCNNGSVIHLKIEPGKITSLVSGSSLYEITVKIKPLAAATWKTVKARCAGQVGSLVELLQGKLSKNVMEIVTRQKDGLFPSPDEIDMSCSCPDYAGMCKHVAATLYGVGNRLDSLPELLFKLRNVDHLELIAQAAAPATLGASTKGKKKKTIDAGELSDVFGIEVDISPAPVPAPAKVKKPVRKPKEIAPPIKVIVSKHKPRKTKQAK